MMQKKTPSPISTVLSSVLNKMGLTQALEEKKIRDHWKELVGQRIAEIAGIDSLRENRLYVKVDNPVWKMELKFQKGEIAKKVNRLIGEGTVKEVVLV